MSLGERRVVGLISDTHGLMRPDVFTALAGVDLILHAGDVGGDEILDELALIAPVHAVYGNTDPPGQPRLSDAIEMEIGGLRVHVSHGHEVGSPTPAKLLARYAADVVVYGHTHKPFCEKIGSTLYFNPGSAGEARLDRRREDRVAIRSGAAGARRFDILPSVARMTIENGEIAIELLVLSS